MCFVNRLSREKIEKHQIAELYSSLSEDMNLSLLNNGFATPLHLAK